MEYRHSCNLALLITLHIPLFTRQLISLGRIYCVPWAPLLLLRLAWLHPALALTAQSSLLSKQSQSQRGPSSDSDNRPADDPFLGHWAQSISPARPQPSASPFTDSVPPLTSCLSWLPSFLCTRHGCYSPLVPSLSFDCIGLCLVRLRNQKRS